MHKISFIADITYIETHTQRLYAIFASTKFICIFYVTQFCPLPRICHTNSWHYYILCWTQTWL